VLIFFALGGVGIAVKGSYREGASHQAKRGRWHRLGAELREITRG